MKFTAFLFFVFPSFLLAELAEYVLKDQQEKQVEDAFGKIYVAKISFLHYGILTNICTVLHPHNLNFYCSLVCLEFVVFCTQWQKIYVGFRGDAIKY